MAEPVRQVVLDVPMTPRECAELAGVHYHTILRRIHDGNLRAYKPAGGKDYVVHPQDFADWLYGSPVVAGVEQAPAAGSTRGSRAPAARGSLAALDAIERGAA